MKICIDAGHYAGYNKYPPFPQYSEGTQMWKLANKLKTKLEKCGIEIVMTKNSVESNPGLNTRGSKAKGCDMFISLHSNAVGSGISTTRGVECYRSIFNNGDTFAAGLCDVVSKTMNTTNRGAKTRKGSGNWDYYGVIKGAVDVGCKKAYLIEHGFHTSVDDASFLINDNNLDKLAEAECDYICAFFGIKKPEAPKPNPVTPTPPTTQHKYKIGDNVTFSTCYVSSTATSAVKPKINNGVITRIVNARNPYLINNGQCWVNDGDIRGYYNAPASKPAHTGTPYKLTAKKLYVRSGKGLRYKIVGEYHRGDIFYVVAWDGNWAKLESGNWMGAKKYCIKV